jgi:hypothetical protein
MHEATAITTTPRLMPPGGDTRLLALAAQLREAEAAHCSAAIARDAVALDKARDEHHPDAQAATVTVALAWRRWESIAREIAETPSNGAAGLAVKARMVLRALADGPANVDYLVADSLALDCERFAGNTGA